MRRKKRKKGKPAFDDYEYGYGYDYLLDDEEQKKPTDTADDADGRTDEEAWWEDESEETVLARIRDSYLDDSDQDNRSEKPDDEYVIRQIAISARCEIPFFGRFIRRCISSSCRCKSTGIPQEPEKRNFFKNGIRRKNHPPISRRT